MRDIGVLAILLDAVDAAAVAGGCQQAVGRPEQAIDDVVVWCPQFARRTRGIELVYLGAVGHQRVVVRGLDRSRRDDRDRGGYGSDTLHRQRRQVALALLPDGRYVDLPGRRFGECGDLALRRIEENEAFAFLVDAIDQAVAIRAREQTAILLEEKRADVLLVALEEGFHGCIAPRGAKAVDCGRPAGRDMQR